MKKKAAAKPATSQETAVSTQTETPSSIQIVKGIKNTLFKSLEIGASALVAGIIRATGRESGNYGDYWQFKGDFAAKVGDTTYRAGTMYLPDVAADLLANAFANVSEAEQDRIDSLPEGSTAKPQAVSVEFKIRLRKQKDEKSNMGFVWVAEPVREIQAESDKVIALLTG